MLEAQFYEPKWFHRKFFYYVSHFLLRRTFSSIYTENIQSDQTDCQTKLIVCNHSMWFDGLIPLFINERFLNNRGLALMDEEQFISHSFFKHIGAQPVNRKNKRSAIGQLNCIAENLGRVPTTIFIFPEGKIVPPSSENSIETGFLNILTNQPFSLQVVYFYSHLMWKPRPELLIIGSKTERIDHLNKMEFKNFISESFKKLNGRAEKLAENKHQTMNKLW